LVKNVTRDLFTAVVLATILDGATPPALAGGTTPQSTTMEGFIMQPETRWRFFTDQVMGGLSTGAASFALEDGQSFARIAGRVSTANRGGFIQMRLDLDNPPPEGTTGVRIDVRGNTQRYFVHLRTGGTLLPWQYDQAGFKVSESWERCGPALYFLPNRGRTRPTHLRAPL
jgi:hypothetical protein